MYDTILFDFDGILLEVSDRSAKDAAIRAALRELDVAPGSEAHQAFYEAMHNNEQDRITALAAEHGIDADRLWRLKEQRMADIQQQQVAAGERTWYDDVSVIAALKERYTLGVVSNNTALFIEEMLTTADVAASVNGGQPLTTCLDTWYGIQPTQDDARRRKPRPYYLEQAADELDAESVLYVGDSNVDIAAAQNAGMDVAFVRRPHRDDYELQHRPTYEVENLNAVTELL